MRDGNSDAPPGESKLGHTCESLRLDLQAGLNGQTWNILPAGFRSQAAAKVYPLPGDRRELQRIVAIPLPPNKRDGGCIYLRRAIMAFRACVAKKQSLLLDIGRKRQDIEHQAASMKNAVARAKAEMEQELDRVREKAAESVASLKDLFDLGRRGLENQMRAHLENKRLNDEPIDARAFRECFRMVSQAVHALGMPSGQSASAREAVLEETARALRSTKDAIALAPGAGEDKPQ